MRFFQLARSGAVKSLSASERTSPNNRDMRRAQLIGGATVLLLVAGVAAGAALLPRALANARERKLRTDVTALHNLTVRAENRFQTVALLLLLEDGSYKELPLIPSIADVIEGKWNLVDETVRLSPERVDGASRQEYVEEMRDYLKSVGEKVPSQETIEERARVFFEPRTFRVGIKRGVKLYVEDPSVERLLFGKELEKQDVVAFERAGRK